MKGFILAAGFGKRMGSLTRHTPKPLLKIGKISLIEHNIEMLKSLGVKDLVINLGYLGQMIEDELEDGTKLGVKIAYSRENMDEGLLDSGGGVKNALSLLSDEPFILVSADIWSDGKLEELLADVQKGQNVLGVVKNPSWHDCGDFHLNDDGKIGIGHELNNVTFSGIGVFCPSFFSGIEKRKFGIIEVIKKSVRDGACKGIKLKGLWGNIGTIQQKNALEKMIAIS